MQHKIRLAQTDDLPVLLLLLQDFYNKVQYPSELFDFDPESVEETLCALIEAKTLLTDGKYGLFGFALSPPYINKHALIAQEMFWWVSPEQRGKSLGLELFEAAESLARWHGAACLVIATSFELNNEKMDNLYAQRGYEKKEQYYIGRL